MVRSILDLLEVIKAEHALSRGLPLGLHSLDIPSSREVTQSFLLGLILHHLDRSSVTWFDRFNHSEMVLLAKARACPH